MAEQDKAGQEKSKSSNTKKDRKRIPLGTRNVLTAPKKPGFARRIINDIGDRVQIFKDAGWNIATDVNKIGDDKAGKATLMGSTANPSVGGGQKGVLVEIPEEIYKADRAESQAAITKVENEIRRNLKQPGQDGLSGNVNIS